MGGIVNQNLSALLDTLTESERRAVEAHFKGETTDESWAIVRWLRKRLKRRVRSRRKPRR